MLTEGLASPVIERDAGDQADERPKQDGDRPDSASSNGRRPDHRAGDRDAASPEVIPAAEHGVSFSLNGNGPAITKQINLRLKAMRERDADGVSAASTPAPKPSRHDPTTDDSEEPTGFGS
jgi:hypothetical protein